MTRVVMVFARAPVAGECKTRLIPALGAVGAAQLQRNLARHVLGIARAWREGHADAKVELWCAPDAKHSFFAECARDFDVSLHEQADGDLGARMWLALVEARRAGRMPVLIGTDCPWLDAAALDSLFAALVRHDCAFIAAEDGGYVAVGMARAVPELFAGVNWGSRQVMRQTQERAHRGGATLAETGRLPDVDVPADLARLRTHPDLAYLVPAVAQ